MRYLESVYIGSDRNLEDFRFPVQLVLRPNLDFRGFAGTIASGVIRAGDEIVSLPSRKKSRVRSIVTEMEVAAHTIITFVRHELPATPPKA